MPNFITVNQSSYQIQCAYLRYLRVIAILTTKSDVFMTELTKVIVQATSRDAMMVIHFKSCSFSELVHNPWE